MSDRQLVFRDAQGHKRSFTMGDSDHLKFSAAFNNFINKHVSEANSTFRLSVVHLGKKRQKYLVHVGAVSQNYFTEDELKMFTSSFAADPPSRRRCTATERGGIPFQPLATFRSKISDTPSLPRMDPMPLDSRVQVIGLDPYRTPWSQWRRAETGDLG